MLASVAFTAEASLPNRTLGMVSAGSITTELAYADGANVPAFRDTKRRNRQHDVDGSQDYQA